MILVLGETYDSLLGLRALLGTSKSEPSLILDLPALSGEAFGEPIVCATIGPSNYTSILCAERAIERYHPDAVFYLGESASLSPRLRLGDIVVGNRLFFHGVNFLQLGMPYGAIPGFEPHFFSDLSLAREAESLGLEMPDLRVLRGDILSGEKKIVDQEEFASILLRRYANSAHLLCYDLGSAGIGFVCKDKGIPFLPLKSITYLPSEGEEGLMKERRISLRENAVAARLLFSLLRVRKGGLHE